MRRLTTIALAMSTLSMGGCALTQQVGDMIRGPVARSEALVDEGKPAAAVGLLQATQAARPDDIAVNVALAGTQTRYVNDELHLADVLFAQGDAQEAAKHVQSVLSVAPRNLKAGQLMKQIRRRAQLRETLDQATVRRHAYPEEALALVNGVLSEQPDFPEALKLRDQISDSLEKDGLVSPRLTDNLRKPVTLDFRSQPLQNIFDVISKMSSVNFVFDKDVQLSTPATLFAAKTTAEDAINLLLRTNQLDKRVLDARTLLIYPAQPDKERNYKEYAIRSFFISQTDAKTVMAALRQMIKPKEIYVDERTNAVIVRDTPATLAVADRIVRSLDIPQSEVTMDVRILEVNTNDKVDLGVDWPGKLTATLPSATDKIVTIGDLLHLHGGDVAIGSDQGSSIQMAINFLQKYGKTKTLANPKIRVRNLEKASINIGQKVPVVTTTSSQGVVSESVAYQDVGLTLKVEPKITLNDEVAVKVDLEVSNILSQDKTKTGLTTYTLGTRKAETLMTARDDETQVLAGLISRDESESNTGLPYLSRIPLLNRLFGHDTSSSDGSEIVLLITPHIERNLALPAASTSAFMSGTESDVTTQPLTLATPIKGSVLPASDSPAMADTITPASISASGTPAVPAAPSASAPSDASAVSGAQATPHATSTAAGASAASGVKA